MTELGQILYGFSRSVPEPVGAVAVLASGDQAFLWPIVEMDHQGCAISTFCRNPLHPGPCKGWKKKLGAIAPGSLHAINNLHKEKLAVKRKATAAAKSAADKEVSAKGHYHPLLHKKAVVKSTSTILGDDEAKASAKASKTILNKTEIKKYSQLKGAQIGSAAVSRGLTSDEKKYSAYAAKLVGDALAKDNQEGGHKNFVSAIASMGDALASSFADKHCGVGTPDGDCDGVTHEGLKQAVQASLTEGLLTGNMDAFDAKAKELTGSKSQEELHAKIEKSGVKLADVDEMLNGTDEDNVEPAPSKPKAEPKPEPKVETPAAKPMSDDDFVKHITTHVGDDAKPLPTPDMTANQKLLLAQLGADSAGAQKQAQALGKTLAKMSPEEYEALPDAAKEGVSAKLAKAGVTHPFEAKSGAPDVLQQLLDGVPDASGKPLAVPSPEEKAAHLAKGVADQLKAGEFLSPGEKQDLLNDVDPQAFLGLSADDQRRILEAVEDLGTTPAAEALMKKFTGSPSGHAGLKPKQLAAGQALADPMLSDANKVHAFESLDEFEFVGLPDDVFYGAEKVIISEAKGGNPEALKLAEKHALYVPANDAVLPTPDAAEENPLPDAALGGPAQFGPGAKPLSSAAGTAVAYAMGAKSGTAKQKLAAYEQLTPEEFQQVSPSSQGLILADLDKVGAKFLDPAKKNQAADIKAKLSLASGGGAGSGGTADTTAPNFDLGAPAPSVTQEAKAAQGATAAMQMYGWVGGEDASGFMKDGIQAQLLKALTSGDETLVNNSVDGTATALAKDLVESNGIPADGIGPIADALKPDVKNVLLQTGEPTPVLDALKDYHEIGKLHPGSKDHAANLVIDQVEAYEAKANGGLNPLEGPSDAKIGKLYEFAGLHAPVLDSYEPGDEGVIASKLGQAYALDKLLVDADLDKYSLEPWKTGGDDSLLKKLHAQLKGDFEKAILAGDIEPGGLAAKLPGMVGDTNDIADKVNATNGWSDSSPNAKAFKSSVLHDMVKNYLDANGGGSPAGAGGDSTHSAPAAAKSAVSVSAPTGTLNSAQKLTVHAAYKSFGAGSYMSADDSEKFDNLVAVASSLAGKAGFPKKLSVADVMAAVDSQIAANLGVPDTNMLATKIKDWLGTPEGAAHVKAHVISPSKVSSLAGYTAPPPKIPGLPKGHLVQKKGGPGKFDAAKNAADFHPHTNAEAQKELDDYLFNNGKVITAGQWDAVTHYTEDGSDLMNPYLRGYTYNDTPYLPFQASDKTKQDVLLIQDAMMPLQSDHLLQRGTGWEFVPAEYRSAEGLKSLIGTNFTDKAFMSTSVAGEGGHFDYKPVVLTIEAPKGTHALFVNKKSSFEGKENEMLLAAGNRFKILGVEEKDGKVHVQVRVVTPK